MAAEKEGQSNPVAGVVDFVEATWEERKLIEWPAGSVVKSATWVVISFIAICTVFLGTVDFVFSKLLGWMVR